MAETAVLFALEEVFQFLKQETNLLRGVHREFSDIKYELESIQVFLKDADRRAMDEADTNDGIRTWVKQLREASFCIEDVIDEYLWPRHGVKPPGCGALVCKIASLIKTLIPHHKKNVKDLSFCHCVQDDSESTVVGKTGRLSISNSPNNLLKSTNNSLIRAINVFEKSGSLEHSMGKLCSQSRILKVLGIRGTSLNHIPKNLGSLFNLRYINLSYTNVHALPKSIGELKNLETLDLRETLVRELQHEINKLTKLRHLLVLHRNYEAKYSLLGFTTGVRMEKGIKNLTCLQNLYYVEVDHGG